MTHAASRALEVEIDTCLVLLPCVLLLPAVTALVKQLLLISGVYKSVLLGEQTRSICFTKEHSFSSRTFEPFEPFASAHAVRTSHHHYFYYNYNNNYYYYY